MRLISSSLIATFLVGCLTAPAVAQEADTTTRTSLIEHAQAEKAAALQPYTPGAAEKWLDYAENYLTSGQLHWHPFFTSAYAGGGFTLGGGYMQHLGSYNLLDLRGSLTFSGYKRVEAAFTAPDRWFGRRVNLSFLGGWREATQVGFYGLGNSTSKDSRVNYGFKQPYASAAIAIFPKRTFRSSYAVPSRPRSGSRPQEPEASSQSKQPIRLRLFRGSARNPPTSTLRVRSGSIPGPHQATRGAADSTA